MFILILLVCRSFFFFFNHKVHYLTVRLGTLGSLAVKRQTESTGGSADVPHLLLPRGLGQRHPQSEPGSGATRQNDQSRGSINVGSRTTG